MDEISLISVMSTTLSENSLFNSDMELTSEINMYCDLIGNITTTLELNSIIP